MIKIQLANLCVALENKYDFIEKLARDYITDGEPEFTVFATDEEIAEEGKNEEGSFSLGYLESIVLYRKIAEKLPEYDAFVFHSAVLSYKGFAYAFTARSGVGKTTHTRLWLSEFGDEVHYLNGDKPIVRFIDGVPTVFGTPYRGKEGYGVNESAPLKAIAFVERATENSADKVEPDDISSKLAMQVYMPKAPMNAIRTLRLVDRLSRSVRLVEIRVNKEPSAAHVAKQAMADD